MSDNSPSLGGKGEDNSPMLPRLVALSKECNHEWRNPMIRGTPIPGIQFRYHCGAVAAASGAVIIDDSGVTIT